MHRVRMIAGLAIPIGDRRRDEEHLGYVDGLREREGQVRTAAASARGPGHDETVN